MKRGTPSGCKDIGIKGLLIIEHKGTELLTPNFLIPISLQPVVVDL